jgi:hypothetical protein
VTVMTILRDALRDLREKRLWPVAAALLVALIGIPAFLSTTTASTPAPSIPPSQAQASNTAGLPVVSVDNAAAHSKLSGHARDPFGQQVAGGSSKSSTVATTGTSSGSSGSPGSGSSGSSTTTSSTTTTPSPTTTTTTTTPTPEPPTGLTDTESYDVALSITNAAGGLDTMPAVERLSVLPDRTDPLLVELGVLKGGKRVLFAVQPGAVVRGPGRCTPGPIDCEILSLGPNQVESVRHASATAELKFAVTGITTQQHGSAAAATRLRRKESVAGRRLLTADRSLLALSLFRYAPGVGAILDLGNLKVG